MNADAELAADLDFPQRPGHEGAEGADRDDLPEAAFLERRSARPYFRSGGAMLICQKFQVGPSAAPYRIIATPDAMKKMVVTPKKPT